MSDNASMVSECRVPRRQPSARLLRAGAAALVSSAVALTLGSCGSAPAAAELPVAVPSTTGTASPTATSPTSTSAPLPTATGALHDADAVDQALTDGRPKQLTQRSAPSAQGQPLTLCPGAEALTPPSAPPAIHREYESAANQQPVSRIVVDAVIYPSVAAASAEAQPLLDAVAKCTTGPAPTDRPNATVTVGQQKTNLVQGMPYGRVVVSTTDAGSTAGSTDHLWVGMIVIDNVVLRITASAPTADSAASQGSRAMAQWIVTVSVS